MIKNILFASDLGTFTPYALSHVESLACQYDADISIVHAVPPIADLTKAVVNSYCSEEVKKELLTISGVSGINEVLRDQVFDLVTQCSSEPSGLLEHLVDIIISTGNPAEIILNEAERKNSDLIVIGSHSPNAVDGHLMGSVVSKVLQLTRTPVFMVPMLNSHNCSRHTKTFPASRFG